MATLTETDMTYTKVVPQQNLVILKIETPDTVDDGDVIPVTLATYGIATVEAIFGFIHTTTDSVIVAEAPTTSVSAGVLSITVGGSTDNKKRVYIIFGESA